MGAAPTPTPYSLQGIRDAVFLCVCLTGFPQTKPCRDTSRAFCMEDTPHV